MGYIVGSMGVVQVMHSNQNASADVKLAQARKVAGSIAKEFGMSPKDLPPSVQTHFAEFGAKLRLVDLV